MIGMYGFVIFTSGGFGRLNTFDELRKSVSARWEPHDIIKGKPLLEYGGPALIEVEFTMNFIKPMTTDPTVMMITLEQIMDFALPLPLVIGLKPMGRGASLFVMSDLSENPKYFYRNGQIIAASVEVRLMEYATGFLFGNISQALGKLGNTLTGAFRAAKSVVAPTIPTDMF
jgi:Phage P2 GpU